MIRPFTCICLLMAASSGLYLYQTKHRTLVLDRRIGAVLKQVDETRAATVMLKAQYAQLSRPDRLLALSQRLLSLRPTTPEQFVQPAALDQHLPPIEIFAAPGSPPPPPPPDGDRLIADAAAALVGQDNAAPFRLTVPVVFGAAATADPVRRPAAALVARPIPRATPRPTPQAPARMAAAGPMAVGARLPSAATSPVAASGSRPASAAMVRAGSAVQAASGSMLGGSSALALAPPVPVAN